MSGQTAAAEKPVVYLFYGENEYAITEEVTRLQKRLGDPALLDMNTQRLDGRTAALAELENAVRVLPFLAERRLVILTHPTARFTTDSNKPLRKKFTDILEMAPATTALVLVEYHDLTDARERKKGKLNWLEEWANQAGGRVYMRSFRLPVGDEMVKWIQKHSKAAGLEFTKEAAQALSDLVGDDTRLADREIQKLLAYANYQREITKEDVEALTPSTARVGNFELVNALRDGDRPKAMKILHKMLAEEEALSILQSIVTQYRLLLLAREVHENGGSADDLVKAFKPRLHPYSATLAMGQAPKYTLDTLEAIYHRLLSLDEGIKTSQIDGDLALELLVSGLTN